MTLQQSETGSRPELGAPAPQPRKRPGRSRRVVWALLPALTFVALVGLWAAVVAIFRLPPYLLPGPQDVIPRLFEDGGQLWSNAVVTIKEILIGFGLTILTAIPLGLLIALSAVAKRVVYPLLVFIQLVPKIAIAPLFLVWFGFGIESKIILTVLMTFFPLLLASISGFAILDDRLLYLTRSMGATGWQTFRYLRLPSALPVVFAGLKTAATIAATAAIVAEFVGSNNGLGYLLLQGTSTLDTVLIFAILFILTLMGVVLNYAVELVEYLTTPWQRAAK